MIIEKYCENIIKLYSAQIYTNIIGYYNCEMLYDAS